MARIENYFISEGDAGKRLDIWLAERLAGYSRSQVKRMIDDEAIKVNGRKVKAGQKLKATDKVEVNLRENNGFIVEAEKIALDILYEDDDIIIVNKPRGMVVHPAAGNFSGTLVNALLEHCGGNLSDAGGKTRPGIVHRLDKNTSGVLVAAKNNKAHESLKDMFRRHDVERVYIALTEGVISAESGKIDAPLGRHRTKRKMMSVDPENGRNAVTYFKVLERYESNTLVELLLETGRTHQIRVHMSYIGHPIAGDTVYGRKKQLYNIKGQALHAKRLAFVHPGTGVYMEFQADPPQDFKELLRRCPPGKHGDVLFASIRRRSQADTSGG